MKRKKRGIFFENNRFLHRCSTTTTQFRGHYLKEIYCVPFIPIFGPPEKWQWSSKLKNQYFQRFSSRYHPDLAKAKVSSIWSPGYSQLTRILSGSSRRARYDFFINQGRKFALVVNRHLQDMTLVPGEDFFLGFTNASLETLEHMHSRGIDTILDQIDPGRVEEEIVVAERKRWPGWEEEEAPIPSIYFDRIEKEWQTASMILVNSSWSKNALVTRGVAECKIITVPQAIEMPSTIIISDYTKQRPLRILWLGSVILRKGIPYLLKAAKKTWVCGRSQSCWFNWNNSKRD